MFILLEAFANLPYEIHIPDVLFEEEFVKFTQEDKDMLLQNGVKISELSESGVERVIEVRSQYNALSVNDCFAFVLAESLPESILLTGDRSLRNLAVHEGIETHGVLWAIGEIHRNELSCPDVLYRALLALEEDETTRLPGRSLRRMIREFEGLL